MHVHRSKLLARAAALVAGLWLAAAPAAAQYFPAPPYRPPSFLLGVDYQTNFNGALVQNVYPGSAAHRVGLQAGDVITEVDGIPVGYGSDLRGVLSSSDGYVRLMIIDRNTGRLVERRVDLTR